MDTLKIKTAKSNQVVFNFVSILPSGISSTVRYRVLIDKMNLYIYMYCCGMATHI